MIKVHNSQFAMLSFSTWWMSCLTHTIRCTVGRNSNFRGATLMVVIYCYWQYRIWNGFYVLFQDTFLWIIEHYLFLSKQAKSFMLFQLPFFYENVIVVDLKKSYWNYTLYLRIRMYIFNDNHIIMFHVTCNVQNAQLFERGVINSKIAYIHVFLDPTFKQMDKSF